VKGGFLVSREELKYLLVYVFFILIGFGAANLHYGFEIEVLEAELSSCRQANSILLEQNKCKRGHYALSTDEVIALLMRPSPNMEAFESD